MLLHSYLWPSLVHCANVPNVSTFRRGCVRRCAGGDVAQQRAVVLAPHLVLAARSHVNCLQYHIYSVAQLKIHQFQGDTTFQTN